MIGGEGMNAISPAVFKKTQNFGFFEENLQVKIVNIHINVPKASKKLKRKRAQDTI